MFHFSLGKHKDKQAAAAASGHGHDGGAGAGGGHGDPHSARSASPSVHGGILGSPLPDNGWGNSPLRLGYLYSAPLVHKAGECGVPKPTTHDWRAYCDRESMGLMEATVFLGPLFFWLRALTQQAAKPRSWTCRTGCTSTWARSWCG